LTESYPEKVALDNAVPPYVYWSTGDPKIRRSQIKVGPDAPSDIAVPLGNVVGLVAARGQVFWTEAGATNINAAPAAGGPTTVFVQGTGGQEPSSMVRDETSIYWIDKSDGSLHRIALP
jgi:hypothetical protein